MTIDKYGTYPSDLIFRVNSWMISLAKINKVYSNTRYHCFFLASALWGPEVCASWSSLRFLAEWDLGFGEGKAGRDRAGLGNSASARDIGYICLHKILKRSVKNVIKMYKPMIR